MTKHFGGPSSDCIDLNHCVLRRAARPGRFIKAEIIMATIPRRPATRDPKIRRRRDQADAPKPRPATPFASGPIRIPSISDGKYRAKPISSARMPWDADKRG